MPEMAYLLIDVIWPSARMIDINIQPQTPNLRLRQANNEATRASIIYLIKHVTCCMKSRGSRCYVALMLQLYLYYIDDAMKN